MKYETFILDQCSGPKKIIFKIFIFFIMWNKNQTYSSVGFWWSKTGGVLWNYSHWWSQPAPYAAKHMDENEWWNKRNDCFPSIKFFLQYDESRERVWWSSSSKCRWFPANIIFIVGFSAYFGIYDPNLVHLNESWLFPPLVALHHTGVITVNLLFYTPSIIILNTGKSKTNFITHLSQSNLSNK